MTEICKLLSLENEKKSGTPPHFSVSQVVVENCLLKSILKKKNERILLSFLYSVVQALEERDKYTEGHSKRVARLAIATARKMELPQMQCRLIFNAALCHDIGKIGIPDHILLKPGRLSEREFAVMTQHTVKGYHIVMSASAYDGDMFHLMAEAALYHHERWDGSGYPEGIKKDKIPLAAQIIAVADSYDAMTSRRKYRKQIEPHEALENIKKLSGVKYSPKIVDAFCSAVSCIVNQKDSKSVGEVNKNGSPLLQNQNLIFG